MPTPAMILASSRAQRSLTLEDANACDNPQTAPRGAERLLRLRLACRRGGGPRNVDDASLGVCHSVNEEGVHSVARGVACREKHVDVAAHDIVLHDARTERHLSLLLRAGEGVEEGAEGRRDAAVCNCVRDRALDAALSEGEHAAQRKPGHRVDE